MFKTMKPRDGGWSVWRQRDPTSAWARVFHGHEDEKAAVEAFENGRQRMINGGVGHMILFKDQQFMAGYRSMWTPG